MRYLLLIASAYLFFSCGPNQPKPEERTRKDTFPPKKEISANRKTVWLTNPDVCLDEDQNTALLFEDLTTHEKIYYDWEYSIPLVEEIFNKCVCKSCSAFKGQSFIAILEFKIRTMYDKDIPTTAKKMKWVIVDLKRAEVSK